MSYCPHCGNSLDGLRETIATNDEQLSTAVDQLLKLTIERVPEQFSSENDMYEEGDERAPFFSEAYLYNLLGKDDARSVLSAVRQLLKAAGRSEDSFKI
jgi:hypothetical protein